MTPPGVADNGGLVASQVRARPTVAGGRIRAQSGSRLLAAGADREQGESWSPGLVPGGLAAVPDALAASSGDGWLALLRDRRGGGPAQHRETFRLVDSSPAESVGVVGGGPVMWRWPSRPSPSTAPATLWWERPAAPRGRRYLRPDRRVWRLVGPRLPPPSGRGPRRCYDSSKLAVSPAALVAAADEVQDDA